MRVGQRLLGADDALLDGRLGHEIGARDLGRGQAADEPQRQRAARLGAEDRMTGGEDQAQHVVLHIVVEALVVVGRLLLLELGLVGELGHAFRASTLLRRNWSMARRLAVCISQAPGLAGMPFSGHCCSATTSASLRQLLGEPDIARHLGQAGDQLGGFDAPDGFDGALGGELRAELVHGRRSGSNPPRRRKPWQLLLLLHLLLRPSGRSARCCSSVKPRSSAVTIWPDLDLHVAVAVALRPLLDQLDRPRPARRPR